MLKILVKKNLLKLFVLLLDRLQLYLIPSELGIVPFVKGVGELIVAYCVVGLPTVMMLPYIVADLTW